MGMEVNNSRLSGMDQAGQVQAQTQKANQAQHADKSKTEQRGHDDTPSGDDVDEFERCMNGSSEKGFCGKGLSGNSLSENGLSGNSLSEKGLSGNRLSENHLSEKGLSENHHSEKGHSEKGHENKLPSVENLFAGIFGAQQTQGTGQPQAVAVEQAAPLGDPDAMDSMVNQMVDRILVSDPAKGQQEVRLTFNDSALKGTEITLFRSLDGQLNVKLNTTDAASYQTLVGAQDSLRAELERNGQNVRVEASLSKNQHENDPNQRSSTYQEYHQDEA